VDGSTARRTLPDLRQVELRPVEGDLTPESLTASLAHLKLKIKNSQSAHEWFDELAWLHGEILRKRGDSPMTAELERALRDTKEPIALRSIIALILGTLGGDSRRSLPGILETEDPQLARMTFYALALKAMGTDVTQKQLYAFWLGAALSFGPEGPIARGYLAIYKNMAVGDPPDSEGISRQAEEVDLPTDGFWSWLDSIKEPTFKLAALNYARGHRDRQTVYLMHDLLPKGDEAIISWAKELYANPIIQEADFRAELMGLVADKKGPEREADLLWMISVETNPDVRSLILQRLMHSIEQSTLDQMIMRELYSFSISEESTRRMIEILSYGGGQGSLEKLRGLYDQSDSENRRTMIVQTLGGIQDDTAIQNGRIDFLGSILNDPSARVRSVAAGILEQMTVVQAKCTGILVDHLGIESDESLRQQIQSWLEKKRNSGK
jgi:hypothetical protein